MKLLDNSGYKKLIELGYTLKEQQGYISFIFEKTLNYLEHRISIDKYNCRKYLLDNNSGNVSIMLLSTKELLAIAEFINDGALEEK